MSFFIRFCSISHKILFVQTVIYLSFYLLLLKATLYCRLSIYPRVSIYYWASEDKKSRLFLIAASIVFTRSLLWKLWSTYRSISYCWRLHYIGDYLSPSFAASIYLFRDVLSICLGVLSSGIDALFLSFLCINSYCFIQLLFLYNHEWINIQITLILFILFEKILFFVFGEVFRRCVRRKYFPAG